MSPKKIILCPNPNRDQGMKTTRAAEEILRDIGFQTVVCSPFRDRKEGAFADYDVKPLPQELRGAEMLITFGGDVCILQSWRPCIRCLCWASTWVDLALWRNWKQGSWHCCGS